MLFERSPITAYGSFSEPGAVEQYEPRPGSKKLFFSLLLAIFLLVCIMFSFRWYLDETNKENKQPDANDSGNLEKMLIVGSIFTVAATFLIYCCIYKDTINERETENPHRAVTPQFLPPRDNIYDAVRAESQLGDNNLAQATIATITTASI